MESVCLDSQQKKRILSRLGSRLTDHGWLIMVSERYRSQHRNKEEVTERFIQLVKNSLAPVKKRYPTRPTLSSQERRIKQKKIRGEIKKYRSNPPGEN
jgi:ribosome-associated protein